MRRGVPWYVSRLGGGHMFFPDGAGRGQTTLETVTWASLLKPAMLSQVATSSWQPVSGRVRGLSGAGDLSRMIPDQFPAPPAFITAGLVGLDDPDFYWLAYPPSGTGRPCRWEYTKLTKTFIREPASLMQYSAVTSAPGACSTRQWSRRGPPSGYAGVEDRT